MEQPKLINNISERVVDDLKGRLSKGACVSIAAASFSIYAYEALKEELEQVEQLRFIFTSPTFIKDKSKKEKREFFIPKLNRERNLYGTDFEIRLRNQLSQKAIAKECADWIRRKVQFRSNASQEQMGGFMHINNDTQQVYIPFNEFTTTQLGCERGANVYNVVNVLPSPTASAYLDIFNEQWNNDEKFEDVENSFEIQKILSIKMKKTFPTTINYLSIDAIKKILAKPDINTSIGRRNLAMLALLYDSGCRVQELIDLNVSSISFISPPTLKIIGKGRKIRMIPLIDKQIEIIKNYMKEYKLMNLERANEPLFFNSRGERFTRQNIAYILIKYANMVRKECPELIPEKISPHIFRHSKAMHLLQAGVNIVYIRDFMGHVSINTTEIYAKADSKMKREAIENAYVKLTDDKVPKWENNENLLSWLENL